MKIGIFSDLHLDFYRTDIAYQVIDNIIEQSKEVDVLLCAGDMANGMENPLAIKARQRFRDETSCLYQETHGNHDFYRSRWVGQNDPSSIDLKPWNLKLVMATLWTDCHYDYLAEMWFQDNMSDARVIPGFSVEQMQYKFERHKDYIFAARPDIVMSHNPPSMMSTGPRFANAGVANKAFMSELGNEIADSDIKLWICGHVHHKHSYMIGKTIIVCNPMGYPSEYNTNPLDYKIEVVELDT